MLYLLACALGASESTTEADDTAAPIPTGGPALYVWEFDCGGELPAWALPAGTIVGMQVLTLLNGETSARGEELTLGGPTPLVDGSDADARCATGSMTGGRIVVNYLPA